MMKVMVFHPGQQHSYQLSSALNKCGLLGCYCTTVYYKPKSLTYRIIPFLPDNMKLRAMSRYCDDIEDEKVLQIGELIGLVTILLSHTKFNRLYKKWNQFMNDYCGKKAAIYAIKNGFDCVISFNNNSKTIFDFLSKNKPDTIRILDASAANVLYMKSIYEYDMQLSPEYKYLLLKEKSDLWDEQYVSRIKDEISSAQYIFSGSKFVKQSYVEFGVDPDNIYICPYGVDLELFNINDEVKQHNSIINCIYVGGTKELKGISYLLEAFLDIPQEVAHLTVVGANTLSDEMKAKYTPTVTFTGSVLHEDIAKLLKKNDLMIFPSLGDGFGLSVIEALATGLPVIVTENTGCSDIVKDGVNGFIIPIQSKDAIIDRVNWFAKHPDQCRTMGSNARLSVENLSWDTYGHSIIASIKEIFEIERNKK